MNKNLNPIDFIQYVPQLFFLKPSIQRSIEIITIFAINRFLGPISFDKLKIYECMCVISL